MLYQLINPVAKNILNRLRDTHINAFQFRHGIKALTTLLLYEALKEYPMHKHSLQTWKGEASFDLIDEEKLLFVSILRAGLPMIESATDLFPEASGGFLAMKRDEQTHQSILYYDRVPPCTGKTVFIVDPMIATGGSLSDAIGFIRNKKPERIITLNIIGSPEGIKVIEKKHPDVDIFIVQIDEGLDENKFIVPGLGDAGDRAYHTET